MELVQTRSEACDAYNLFMDRSVFVLDCCSAPSCHQPFGAISLDATLPIVDAVDVAWNYALEHFMPDDQSSVILFDDSDDREMAGLGSPRGFDVAQALCTEKRCTRVVRVSRRGFERRYGFLMEASPDAVFGYPSEIIEGTLFLGSACSIAAVQLDNLQITHILSVIDRDIGLPPGRRKHLRCHIEDSHTSDLTAVLKDGVGFVASAIEEGGTVLVHCEQGRSRSASVVMAYLMRLRGFGTGEALSFVKARRPCAQPNPGFIEQLQRFSRQLQQEHGPGVEDATPVGRTAARTLSSHALTAWLTSSFFADPGFPEHIAIKNTQMGSWLEQASEADDITARDVAKGCGTLLENVLTRQECQRIIQATERLGYGVTNFLQEYRGDRRLQLDDVSGLLAERIWQRIRPHVPARLVVDWMPEGDEYPSGTWTARGCNSRFRFSKYFAGGCFKTHADDICLLGDDRCTLLTVNIYLNDLELDQGGRTRFFLDRGGDVLDSVGGLAGSALLFKQEEALHDGAPLSSGLKYLMRTDVVYAKSPE